MKIVVIGGTGLIGRNLVTALTAAGHTAVPASPSTGVDTLTGAGVKEVLQGAEVVVDVTNSPSFEASAVMDFFQTSTRNLLAASRADGVKHYIALSIVRGERGDFSGYLKAKIAQEELIEAGGIPFTILRATQFFEFMTGIADASTSGDIVTLPQAQFQPVAVKDVVSTLADIAVAAPANGVVNLAGPERASMANLVGRVLAAKGDPRKVTDDPNGLYFGSALDAESLVPAGEARLGATSLDAWLKA
jgi:uncharacterized protein YbjT (DUF2867 family)